MHLPRLLLLAAFLSLAIAAACGDGGSKGEQVSNELSDVPTATLPNPLPEPIIVGDVQPPSADGTSYTVQSGDTLGSIADAFGTTVYALLAVNDNVDPTALVVGQVLIIPAGGVQPEQGVLPATVEPTPEPPTGETTYTVQTEDNADAIAASFGITLDELIAANNTTLEDIRHLQVGDVLTIPAPAPP